MEPYSVTSKPSVEHDLRRLPEALVARAIARIEQLQTDPFPRQAIKLTGTERFYRLRVGDYRIIYEVDSEIRRITVHYVRHRREAYRAL